MPSLVCSNCKQRFIYLPKIVGSRCNRCNAPINVNPVAGGGGVAGKVQGFDA